MNNSYYGMLVRDPFSEIHKMSKTPNRSLYFKDEAWMKYHKCPLCENYVLKEPERIKVPRGSAGTHKINMWNEALWVICWDKKATPCIKCVSDLTRYFMLDHPITATRTGLVVGGELNETWTN